MSDPLSRLYIGDGVYADFSSYDIKLYTNTGDEIFLEFNMLDTLGDELKRLIAKYKDKKDEAKNGL